jgi:hypothetical protein
MRWWPRSIGGRIALVAAAVVFGWPVAITAIAIVIALIATAIGLAVAFGPWLALGFVAYRLLRRRPSRGRPVGARPAGLAGVAPEQAGPPPSAPPQPPDPLARVPAEQRAQVDRIRQKAASLLGGAGRFPAGSRNLHLVRRTLDAYLPATLDAYLSLPPGTDDWTASPDGRTSVQVLRDQLTLLETRLDEVATDLWQTDVQRLLANERFLEEHFGRRQPDELTIS